jgi:hypothetical protein
MFLAAFTSRAWTDPQRLQVNSHIPRPALSFGLLAGLLSKHEQDWVVYLTLTSSKTTSTRWHLYSNIVFRADQSTSSMDFAMFVFTSFELDTSHTKIAACPFTCAVLILA